MALAACNSSGSSVDASACSSVDGVMTAMAVPTVDPVTADLVVYGSVQAPTGVAVLGVSLSAVAASFNIGVPPPTIGAASDTGEFAIWHATVPYAVMVAPLESLPGQIVLVAVPHMDCPLPVDDLPAIAWSRPLTVDPPPAMVDAGAP